MTHTPANAEPDSQLPTRQSLLSRLRDLEDQEGWREFFETYWRLVYAVARDAGLADGDAQDVVQNTFIYLARRMPRFRYDRSRGSFKSWLRVVTRSRIHAHVLRERRDAPLRGEPLPGERVDEVEAVELQADPGADALDKVWQREWEKNLLERAFDRLRKRVSSQQLMIFQMATLGGLPLRQVAARLEVNLAQIYLARHRVGRLLKAEVARLRQEAE
ncbi:RNA polymerase, sigma-24 subunit, ECF subfamily [Verrucomicrobia bacterium]|nr:RNA polymerase, sigma-24 subunit, ECF subfamily [Verrucomicrobiota bacterium]